MAPPDLVPTVNQLVTDRTGQLVLSAASHLGIEDEDSWARRDFIDLLVRVKSKTLILLGPPPYPETPSTTFVVDGVAAFDLVHGRTGRVSRLFAVYDPALTSGVRRRAVVAALVAPHFVDYSVPPPIVLVGGTRSSSFEKLCGAWVVQVGVFYPLEGLDNIMRIERMGHKLVPSYGGTYCHINLDDRDCQVFATFADYSWWQPVE